MPREVVIVGCSGSGLHGNGKVLPQEFFPVFKRELAAAGYKLFTYWSVPRFEAKYRSHDGALVLSIFNEETRPESDAIRAEIRHLGRLCSEIGAEIIHPLDNGLLIADKPAVNRLLGQVIPMPPVVESGTAFSADPYGSGRRVMALDVASPEAAGRYNTRLIDTTYEFDGSSYYLSLRAMTVGPVVTSVFARCRPVADGNLSVHNKDTPLDPPLLNHLHEFVVVPARPEIERICALSGKLLASGFYAYDILPERGTGRLHVCELGYKLHDPTLAHHLAPIAAQLEFYEDSLGESFLVRNSRAFIDQYCNAPAAVGG